MIVFRAHINIQLGENVGFQDWFAEGKVSQDTDQRAGAVRKKVVDFEFFSCERL